VFDSSLRPNAKSKPPLRFEPFPCVLSLDTSATKVQFSVQIFIQVTSGEHIPCSIYQSDCLCLFNIIQVYKHGLSFSIVKSMQLLQIKFLDYNGNRKIKSTKCNQVI